MKGAPGLCAEWVKQRRKKVLYDKDHVFSEPTVLAARVLFLANWVLVLVCVIFHA